MAIRKLKDHMSIGLLENGTMLFLYSDNKRTVNGYFEYDDDKQYELHWYDNKNSWRLKSSDGNDYLFELPQEMLNEWKIKTDHWQNDYVTRKEALKMKVQYFPQIILFRKIHGTIRVEVLRISKSFLDQAAKDIEK